MSLDTREQPAAAADGRWLQLASGSLYRSRSGPFLETLRWPFAHASRLDESIARSVPSSGHIFAGDMLRGFDVYRVADCSTLGCTVPAGVTYEEDPLETVVN